MFVTIEYISNANSTEVYMEEVFPLKNLVVYKKIQDDGTYCWFAIRVQGYNSHHHYILENEYIRLKDLLMDYVDEDDSKVRLIRTGKIREQEAKI